jgi:membrane-bound ClpP family serine protease
MDPAWIWVLTFAIGAVVLFVLEIVIPSGGLLGIIALSSLIGANIALFFVGAGAGLVGLLASAVLVPAGIVIGVKVFPHTFVGRRLILADRQPTDDHVRYTATGDENYRDLVGQRGVVQSEMHPVGTVRFGARRVECLSATGIIEPGTPVEVIGVSGFEVKVRPVG